MLVSDTKQKCLRVKGLFNNYATIRVTSNHKSSVVGGWSVCVCVCVWGGGGGGGGGQKNCT